MSHTPKLTLIGLYNYDPDLFINFNLPAGIDKETAIDNLLLNHGEQPVLYGSGDFIKIAIGAWSRKWYNPLDLINKALNEEYNPLHNFDRNEEYTDKEEMTSAGSSTGTDERMVSAYNASDYQPDEKSKAGGSSETESARTFIHTARLYGNIGVTTSQQMLEAEVDLRSDTNIYSIISKLFYHDFIVPVY